MFHGNIFLSSVSAATSEFCEWVQVGMDVYIPHHKKQVNPHTSPWFPAACAAAIVHRNHLFYLYQQNQSSNKERLAIVAKGFLNLPNLHMLIKQRVHHFPENWTFEEFVIVFSKKPGGVVFCI